MTEEVSFIRKLKDLCYPLYSWIPYSIRVALDPRTWYFEIKWFIQRGRRGWSDYDVSGLNDYLSRVISGSVKCLHSHPTRGIPSAAVRLSGQGDIGFNDVSWDHAGAEWDKTLLYIHKQFRNYSRRDAVCDRIWNHYYHSKFPFDGMLPLRTLAEQEARYAASKRTLEMERKYIEVQSKQFEHACHLLGKAFPGLWY